jgi:phytoene dehydrogenase-like protein
MSVFAQYVPYALAEGGWDERREAIADLVIAEIARFAPDVADCIVERQVLGPPDVEARIGLTGGHIFQGECLPDQMWDRRFSPATPVPGLYLCGAGTHPGGTTCTWRWATLWEIRLLLATKVPSAPNPASMAAAIRRVTENTGTSSESGSSGNVTTC